MAMIICSECGRAISNKASACVGCGAPIAVAPDTVAPDVNAMPSPDIKAPPSPAQIKRRALYSLCMLLVGVAWASFVDREHDVHRLSIFCAALLIIAGICGLLLALVHSAASDTK